MTDRPLGPGWWQASDAQWYPPELHPDATPDAPPDGAWVPPSTAPGERSTSPTVPPAPGAAQWAGPPPSWTPPPPPAAPGRRRRTAWIAVAGAVVVALVAVVVFIGSSSSTRSGSSVGASIASDSAAPDTTPTGPIVAARRAGVRITLPEGWVGASIEDGVNGVGAAMFPNDPAVASDVEQRLQALPRLIVLFGVKAADSEAATHSAGRQFVANMNVLHDTTVPKSMSLEAAATAEARSVSTFGGKVQSVDLVRGGGRDMKRVTYTVPAGLAGTMYVVGSSSGYWVLTYTFEAASDSNTALADASAASFVAD